MSTKAKTSGEGPRAVTSHDPARGPSLSAAQWKQLVAKYWDKAPVVFKAPFGTSSPRSEDLFPGLIAACEAQRHGDTNVRFYLEQRRRASRETFAAQVSTQYDDLPNQGDTSLRGYARRITRAHNPKRFCLIVTDLQRFDWKLSLGMRPFLRDACKHGIATPGGASMTLLLGNYRRTPFGVHKDELHVFTCVVEGSKHALLWPFEAFAEHPTVRASYRSGDLKDRGAHVVLTEKEFRHAADKAIVLNAKRGDLIYWPASYWHVVLGTDAPAMTVSWDLRTLPKNADLLALSQASERASGWRRLGPRAAGVGGDLPLPASLEKSLKSNASKAAAGSARQFAAGAWLRFATGLGCTQPPDPHPFDELQETEVVRGSVESPIAWTRTTGDHCVFSANGHSLDLMADAGTLDLVCDVFRLLNRRRALPVLELTGRFTGRRKASRETMRDVLAVLGSWSALHRV